MELTLFHKLPFLLFMSIFLISVSLCAQKTLSQEAIPVTFPTFNIQTQSYFHDQQADSFVYREAQVQWDGMTLEGGEIRIDRIKGNVVATGYVRFKGV